ncbi:glycosyltransferase family 2 protein [Thermoleophilia bacterium SCSIO 60948]|nr:glycosyltransferase family 2 protein [Thermoleophilia bacterium SCSIO 60948]
MNPEAPISIVVPATDDPPTLDRCLAAIETARREGDELIVVDGPLDGGPAAARNRGAARASTGALAFVDADVVLAPDALDRLRRALSEPGVDAVFGSYDASPEAPGRVSRFRNLLHHHVHSDAAGPATTFWAGLGGVRRDVFERSGGFDAERYPVPSIEDIELGMRLSSDGARIELRPEIQGTHLKAWTLRSFLATDLLRRGVPWVALLRRRGVGSGALNLGVRHRAGALASVLAAFALVARRPRILLIALTGQVLLHLRFYALLGRRGGPGLAAAGVALHALHNLAAAASVPLGVLAARRDREDR